MEADRTMEMNNITNCPNCGAPIQEDVCPYCGTVIWDFATIDLNRPRWVKVKLKGEIVIVRAILTNLTFDMQSPERTAYYDNNIYLAMPPSHNMDMHMVIIPDDEGTIVRRKELEDERRD